MARFAKLCGTCSGKFAGACFASEEVGANGEGFRLLSIGRSVEQGLEGPAQNGRAHYAIGSK